MMRYIIAILLLTSTLSAQTKWRQIERSNIKWQVPAAFDSIPGVTGYASKYIGLQTLVDTLGIEFPSDIDSLTYRNDTLFLYIGSGYYFTIIEAGGGPFGSSDDGNVAYWRADTLAGDTAHYWDRTNKRLGLNTKTPESLLHVKKNEFALPVAEFDNPGTNGKTVLIKHGSSSDGRYPLQITTPAGSSYFDGRGYLGLGVSPSYPLHIKNSSGISRFENTNSNGDAGFDLYHSSKWWRIAMNAEGGSTNNVHFRDITGSRYPLTLQSSNGYVGVLNITPGRELDVTGRVRVSTLDTDGSAPSTNGTTKMVITDGNGDLSFANIPSGGGIDSTILIGGWGIEAVESPLNTWNLVADTTQVATLYDLTLKQDKLVSGTNIKTINSTTLLGSGNITAVTSVGTSAPLTGGTITGTGTIGLSYDNTYMGLNGSSQLYPLYNIATWNANQLRGSSIAVPFTPSSGDVLTYNGSAWAPAAPSGGISGGTTNYITKFTSATTIGNSQLQDNGSTVGLGIAPDASYKFKVGSGNVKIGDATAGTLNKLYFGNGTNVYVGEDVADDRLYLRGSSLSIQTGGSLGSNGNVLTSNGTTASWVAPPSTSLSYVGTASPITLQPSGGGSIVRFLAGSNITLSRSGADMTISAVSGGGLTGSGTQNHVTVWSANNVLTGLPSTITFGSLNQGGVTTYGDYVMIDNSLGGDAFLHDGDGIDIVRSSANYAGYKLSQSYGQLLNSVNTGTAITATDTKINFSGSLNSGNISVNTANDNITLNQAGDYEIEFSTTLYTTNLATRRVYITMYIGTSQQPSVIEMIQDVGENKYASVSKSRLVNGAAGEQISIQIRYDNAVGSGNDIYYRFPSLIIKRVK